MRKLIFTILLVVFAKLGFSTIHEIRVWDGYFQFVPNTITIDLGDTIDWLPLDQPSMVHTITSDSIPAGAATFDYTWQAPADTFFRYIPTVSGVYNYVCTPHESIGMVGSFTVVDPGNVSENESDIVVYPNPVSSELIVPSELVGEAYEIFDVQGSLVEKGKLESTVKVALFRSGVYYLRLQGVRTTPIRFIVE